MTSEFTHLHLHSQYSLLDGAIRLKDLFPKLKELGMDSVALTDHGNMFGTIDFYKKAKAAGIKPIFGCETYICADRTDRQSRRNYHLILLARDNQGYHNLRYLNSMGFLEGFYYHPRIDKKLLKEHSQGLFGLSACLGGEIAQTLLKNGYEQAKQVAEEYRDLFEPGAFHLEIQPNGLEEQANVNESWRRMSRETGIPLIATGDCHYIHQNDARAHEILMAIQQGRTLADDKRLQHKTNAYYIKSPAEFNEHFHDIPEALENSVKIARACNVELQLGKTMLPRYQVPEGYDIPGYFRKISEDGLVRRFEEFQKLGKKFDPDQYRAQLQREIEVIVKMDFPGYFLIVWDFINYAKEHGIPVGPGRGSGAGSIVAYSLRITDLDPIPYNLLFERFLNPERISMPDFDIDFCMNRRDEVIKYVSEHYGKNQVGQIITFGSLSAKSAIKDVGRVMGLPYADLNDLTKNLPNLVEGHAVTLQWALDNEPKFKQVMDEKPQYRELIDIARALEGLHRNAGMHAAGIVISEKPLWEYVPCYRGQNGEIVTQFAKDEVEEAGLVKFDFLGLKTLTVIDLAVKMILTERPDFDLRAIPLDDTGVYRMISDGDTTGVFQLESSGFKELLKKLKPDCFEDIIAAGALYRPGPLEGGMVNDFINRKHGRTRIVYHHPSMETILKETYGVIVYQEQVMQISRALAGYSLGGADLLRRAMGKKKKEVMEKEKAKFLDGAKLIGVDQHVADEVFDLMAAFAGYGFNKSHSAAYGLVTYQTAYLKYHYPQEFMASLLTCDKDDTDKVVKNVAEIRAMGTQVLRPDIIQSGMDFSVVKITAAQSKADSKGQGSRPEFKGDGRSSNNVTPGGTSGQLLGVDAVREFNVVSDTYSAAYGKRDGAQISIVTASGTNKLHGDAYEFLRNSFFDARNYFDQARIPEFQRNNYGAALGGPIRRDKLFLFGNFEEFRQNLGLSLDTLVPDNQARLGILPGVAPIAVNPISARLLNLWPVQNGPEVLQNGQPTGIANAYGTAQQHIREDFGTTRFDANLTPNDLLFAVYTVDDSTAHTPSQDPYSVVDERLREQVLSLQEQHVFSPRFLNTARLGFSRASFFFLGSVPADIQAVTPTFIPGKPTGAVVIAGSTASNGASAITTAGANVGSNNAITRNLYTFDDHVFYTLGKHQIEAGVWLQRLQSNDNLAQDQYGQASFASLTTFLQGTIKTFTYAPQVTELGWRTLFADAYLEDTFHVTPRLEVRAGFRSQSSTGWSETQGRAGVYNIFNGVIQTNPSVQSNALTDNRALFLPEPRLGVAWNVFGDGKTSVRASVGFHHSLLDALDYRLDQAAPFNTVYSYSSTTSATTVANPTGGTGAVSPSTVATDMATPTLLAYSLKIEQQLAPSTSLTVGYNGSHSYHQILSGDLNEPGFVICPAAACPVGVPAGTIYYPNTTKPNTALANSTSWWSGGSGNYNALIVDFRHDLAHGLQFRANYTWSKNLDDGSAWNTSVSANTPAFVEVPQLPHLDYGPASTDIRHLAAFNGTYDLPLLALLAPHPSHLAPLQKAVLGGWSLSTIANLQSGYAFSPQLGYNPTGSGDSRNPVRPNYNRNFTGSLYNHGSTAQKAAQYFNPAAFSAPLYGTVGNAPRDGFNGPGFADWDVSLLKATRLSEATRLQFRAEIFNILNHTNLQIPNAVLYSAGPTQGTTANQNTALAAGTPGVITSTANTSRQIQLGLKLLF